MHFHLRKPLHGWREFAGEVGIIVLGRSMCLPITTTRVEGNRMSVWPVGEP
jgi:hypothetical protein